MKYYRILNETETEEQELLERQELKNDCWAISPKWFFSWFFLGWFFITIISLLVRYLMQG
jgi:hypothetical protein